MLHPTKKNTRCGGECTLIQGNTRYPIITDPAAPPTIDAPAPMGQLIPYPVIHDENNAAELAASSTNGHRTSK